ncbi:MAG: aldo/keto reductase [Bryobacterales bacterium]|nr:aldo/keto reductase [Bryobacterales bacterium]MCZ2148632.1 aldo/keto reductase [Bryobacterales bacterium]
MRRRAFLSSSTAAGLSLSAQSGNAAKTSGGGIPKRVFGKTGEKLTIIGQAGGRFPLCSFEEAKAITLRAYELGINYFDTARIYWGGRSEEVYGAVLPPFRKHIFLTTKSPVRDRKGAEADLEKSLRALKTDYVDLWQIHQVNTLDEVKQIFAPGGAIEAFEAAKKAGKCRFMGFTGHHDPETHLAMLKNYAKYDTILMPLNPADPSYLSFEKMVLPVAVERGMGIQGMKSTGNAGLLSGIHVKDCLGYVLSLPIHCLALGCTTVGQIEDDARIAKEFKPLTEQQMAELRRKASRMAGPRLENWKRDTQKQAEARRYWDGALA